MRGLAIAAITGLVCIGQLTPALSAQTSLSEGLQIFPGRGNDGASFISRCLQLNGSNDVSGLVEYKKDAFQGIGDVTSGGTTGGPAITNIKAIVLRFQDQNDRTQHSYDVVFRLEKTGGGPDLSTAGAWALFNGVPSPTASAPQGTPAGWAVELSFQDSKGQPAPLPIPQQQTFFFGMTLKQNASWPTSDGLSFYEAQYDPTAQKAANGDNPRQGAPNLTWEVVGTNATNNFNINPFLSTGVVLNYSMICESPVLQIGAVHLTSFHSSKQGYGAAGLYPDVSATRMDGLSFRIAHTTTHTPGDRFGLFLALNSAAQVSFPLVRFPGINGSLYLGPLAQMPLFTGAMNTSSPDTEVIAAQVGSIPASAKGVSIYFQAYVTTGAIRADLTNMAVVSF